MHKRALATALAQKSQPTLLSLAKYVRISFDPVRDPPASEREAAWTGRNRPLTEPRRRLNQRKENTRDQALAWQTISPSARFGTALDSLPEHKDPGA